MLVKEAAPRYDGLRVTREQYLDLPDDGFSYTMVNGVLEMSPSADSRHAFFHTRLVHRVMKALDTFPVGRLYCELDVFLPDGGDVVRPDLCFVRNENLGIVLAHIHGTPDLVIEILSASTRDRDLGVKADRYARCGVREYWIIDPVESRLQLLTNEGGAWRADPARKSELVPGFVLDDSLLAE